MLNLMSPILLAVLWLASGAAEPPPIPMSFYGTLLNSSGAPLTQAAGQTLEGLCVEPDEPFESTVIANNTVFLDSGAYWYALDVPGCPFDGRPCCEPEHTVRFRIGTTLARESWLWISGATIPHSLTFPVATAVKLRAFRAQWAW